MQEHYGEGIPDKACLLELGWYMKEMIVSYVECKRCGQKGCQVEKNRGQEVILDRQKWYGCQKRKKVEVAHFKRGKAQQSGAQAGVPEGTAKEGGEHMQCIQMVKGVNILSHSVLQFGKYLSRLSI